MYQIIEKWLKDIIYVSNYRKMVKGYYLFIKNVVVFISADFSVPPFDPGAISNPLSTMYHIWLSFISFYLTKSYVAITSDLSDE